MNIYKKGASIIGSCIIPIKFLLIFLIDEVEDSLKEIPWLTGILHELKSESLKYEQLKTMQAHLKDLYNIPESVKNTENLIEEGKLLEAHKELLELERNRDDLLFKLHQENQNTNYENNNSNLIKEHFASVSVVSIQMEKKLKFILRRTLNTVVVLQI